MTVFPWFSYFLHLHHCASRVCWLSNRKGRRTTTAPSATTVLARGIGKLSKEVVQRFLGSPESESQPGHLAFTCITHLRLGSPSLPFPKENQPSPEGSFGAFFLYSLDFAWLYWVWTKGQTLHHLLCGLVHPRQSLLAPGPCRLLQPPHRELLAVRRS